MSKRGLPTSIAMRHDSHYVDELSTATRTIGKSILIDRIEPNPDQPRREFGDLTELSASIKEKGVLEPLLVKPGRGGAKYMIIAGERRWQASKLAGLSEVPCIEMDLDEQGVAEIALIENLQRKDLTVWEEADGLKALADKFGYKQEEIAKKISKSRTTVTELMTVAGLPMEIRERCRTAKINSKASLLDVARQFDEAAMFEYLDKLESGNVPNKNAVKSNSAKKASSNGAAANLKGKLFRYDSMVNDFQVEIRFAEDDTLTKNVVLKALKDTFDAVKAGDIEV